MKDSRGTEAPPNDGPRRPTNGLTRRTPMRKRNAKRKGHRFPKHVNEAYREYIRGLSCEADEVGFPWWARRGGSVDCDGPIHPAHVKSRGAGGPDIGNIVPLCARHHHQQHSVGIKTFQAIYDLDLAKIAAKLALAYDPEEPPVW